MHATPRRRAVLPEPANASGLPARVRRAAAEFWLAMLFRTASFAPRVVRAAKPLFVTLAYQFSSQIRASTAANVRRIVRHSPSRAEQRKFGRRVVASFFDFVCDVGRSARATRE